jgi:hypothetical protein
MEEEEEMISKVPTILKSGRSGKKNLNYLKKF